jgi:hypothetical protein
VLDAIDLVLKAHEPAANSVLTVTHGDGKTLQYKGIPVRESVHVDLTGTDDKLISWTLPETKPSAP